MMARQRFPTTIVSNKYSQKFNAFSFWVKSMINFSRLSMCTICLRIITCPMENTWLMDTWCQIWFIRNQTLMQLSQALFHQTSYWEMVISINFLIGAITMTAMIQWHRERERREFIIFGSLPSSASITAIQLIYEYMNPTLHFTKIFANNWRKYRFEIINFA